VRAIKDVVTQIKEASVNIGLAINESKRNYMKINRNVINLEPDLIIDVQVFEGVQNFRFLGALIHSKKLISDKIKSRKCAGNKCFYSLRQIFSGIRNQLDVT